MGHFKCAMISHTHDITMNDYLAGIERYLALRFGSSMFYKECWRIIAASSDDDSRNGMQNGNIALEFLQWIMC